MKAILIFSLFISVINCDLTKVHVIARNGEREPNEDYFPNVNFETISFGITSLGNQQAYILGQRMRERYGPMADPDRYPDTVVAQSGSSSRNNDEAQAILAGWFPPSKDKQVSPLLAWRPLAVTTNAIIDTTNVCGGCTAYVDFFDEILQEPENMDIYNYIISHMGDKHMKDLCAMLGVVGIAIYAVEHGLINDSNRWLLQGPMDIDLIAYQDKMSIRMAAYPVILETNTAAMMSLITTQMESTKDHNHKTNIVQLLVGLQVPDVQSYYPISYGAFIIIEVHQDNFTDAQTLKFFYGADYNSTIEPITFDLCPAPCSMQTFIDLYPMTTEYDFKYFCSKKQEDREGLLEEFLVIAILTTVVMAMFILCVQMRRVSD